jgi:uncharacterized integral membrane protein
MTMAEQEYVPGTETEPAQAVRAADTALPGQLPPSQPPPQQAPHRQRPPRRLPRRLSGLWVTLASGAIVLVLLLIFILENGKNVDIAYFGAHGQLPLGVALLFAAVFGNLLVLLPWAGRMLQLRMAARRRRKHPPGSSDVANPPQPGSVTSE